MDVDMDDYAAVYVSVMGTPRRLTEPQRLSSFKRGYHIMGMPSHLMCCGCEVDAIYRRVMWIYREYNVNGE